MAKFIDLTGHKYGKLTVIKKSDKTKKSGRIYWDCICEEGNKVTVAGNNLRNGHTQSCGCMANRDPSIDRDLTGQTFGRWTVLSKAESRKGQAYWNCKCSCPKQTEKAVCGMNLINGKSTSCRCYVIELRNATRKAEAEKLIGKVFGLLTVIEIMPKPNGGRLKARCICDCPRKGERIVVITELKSGNVKSCGCLQEELNIYKQGHGEGDSQLYNAWHNMIRRCYVEGTTGYEYYGGRVIDGIPCPVTVINEWRYVYENFRDWANANGYIEGKRLSLERKDNLIGYCPDNCIWIPLSKQSDNRRNVIHIEIDGVTKNMSEWCKINEIAHQTASRRIKAGWDYIDAVTKPPNQVYWNRWAGKMEIKNHPRKSD